MTKYRLVMRTGPTPGQVFEFSENELTLGREPGNEIAINDAEISRKHARLSFQSGTYMIEDLGSTNGTFVNGQRLMGPHALRAGEIVSFGEQISCTYETISEADPNATIIASKDMAMPAADSTMASMSPVKPPSQPPAAPPPPPMPPPAQPTAMPPAPTMQEPPQPRSVPPAPGMQPPPQPRAVPPAPGFAGKVPAGPAPQAGPAAPPPKARSSRTFAIVAGIVVLCVVCGCLGFFYFVDTYQSGVLYCQLPILKSLVSGCP